MANDNKKPFWLKPLQPKKSPCCNMVIEEIEDDPSSYCCNSINKQQAEAEAKPSSASITERHKLLIELLVIDLKTCARCVPTNEQLKTAIELLAPVADALGIALREETIIVQTREEARRFALLSSPTIRINGRDITQDIHESKCESCCDLAGEGASIDCREWHYKGNVYTAAPLPLLLEAIMEAMLEIDFRSMIELKPLKELPENLDRFFASRKMSKPSNCCS